MGHNTFIVLAEATEMAEPGQGALNHPALGQDDKTPRGRVAFDNVKHGLEMLAHPGDALAAIAAIGPQPLQASAGGLTEFVQHELGAIPVLDVGGVDGRFDAMPQRIPTRYRLHP